MVVLSSVTTVASNDARSRVINLRHELLVEAQVIHFSVLVSFEIVFAGSWLSAGFAVKKWGPL